jgi:hypothetical protein
MDDETDRFFRQQAVKDAVQHTERVWLVLLGIVVVVFVAWGLNLRTCQNVDWTSYFNNPDDARALGAHLEYPTGATLCTYAVSGDKELTLDYLVADSVTVKLPK